MVGLASAAGLVGFLSESDPELKVFALQTLNAQIDLLWTEVVDSVPQMFVSHLASPLPPYRLFYYNSYRNKLADFEI